MSTLTLFYIVAAVCGMVIGGSISYLLVDYRRGKAMNKALADLRARHDEEREYWQSRQHAVAREMQQAREEAAEQVRHAKHRARMAEQEAEAQRRRKENAVQTARRLRRKTEQSDPSRAVEA